MNESRRTLLKGLGAALVGGTLITTETTAEREAQYHLAQGDTCVPLAPLSGREPVEELYDYQLPADEWAGDNGASDDGGPYYSSKGIRRLQRDDTSTLFLYDGPNGLSLVIVHGKVGTSPNGGGSATFTVSGLPSSGQWVVRDDYYLDPRTGEQANTNYDRWSLEGSTDTIVWTWGGTGTDGAAFRGLGGEFEVTIDPAFNDAADRLARNYEGTVTDWQVLSGTLDSPDRHSLALADPVTIRAGPCPGKGDESEAERTETEKREEQETEKKEKGEDEKEENGGTYTVCHRPPGNPENAHTITVGSESAVEEHEAHGDSRGACETDT